MLRSIGGIVALSLAAQASGCAPHNTGVAAAGAQPVGAAVGSAELREAMRALWSEHVIWTRGYVVAALAAHPSAEAALSRLLRNQEEIGAAIAPLYGAAAGNRLTALLVEHIEIAGEVVAAAQARDDGALAAADRRWHRNAGEIAAFLAAANPHWTAADLQHMLNEHLALTTQAVVARLQGDWEADVAAFDAIHAQALDMADALTDGIVRQFPDRR